MSPPENSHKLSEAFAEYLPDDSKFIFILVEKAGAGAWVSTMSLIRDPEARVEVLQRAIEDEEKGKDSDAANEIENRNSKLYARACQMIFSGLHDDLTCLQLREKLHKEFVGEEGS